MSNGKTRKSTQSQKKKGTEKKEESSLISRPSAPVVDVLREAVDMGAHGAKNFLPNFKEGREVSHKLEKAKSKPFKRTIGGFEK